MLKRLPQKLAFRNGLAEGFAEGACRRFCFNGRMGQVSTVLLIAFGRFVFRSRRNQTFWKLGFMASCQNFCLYANNNYVARGAVLAIKECQSWNSFKWKWISDYEGKL